MRKKIFSILAGVMMIALTVAGVVYAGELTDFEVEGWVEGVDLEDGYLVVDGDPYMIVDDSEVDEEIVVGDWVKIKYYLDEEEQMIIIEVEIEDEPEMEYEEFEVEGTFKEIDGDILTLEEYEFEFLITDDSEIEDDIEPGDYVKVKYYLDEDEQMILIEVELEDEDEDEMDDDMAESPVCTGDMMHPALMKLAESYGVEYDALLPYFCEQNFGVGEIMLALKTAGREDVEGSFEDILMLRSTDGMKDVGWGEIWQDLGLIGKGKQENEEADPQAMKNKHQEKFQFEGEEEQFEYEANRKEKNENKPSTPPGLSGDHPGKGKGRGN